jgi:hypothetical protein
LQNSQRIEFGGRQRALQQTPENAPDSDVDFKHPQHIAARVMPHLESNVVDANHFAPLRIDDLLVQ